MDRTEQGHGSVFAVGQDTVVKVLPFTPSQIALHKEILGEANVQAEQADVAKTKTLATKEDHPYEQIGGLAAQIKTVREMVEIPLHNPHIFTQFGKVAWVPLVRCQLGGADVCVQS